MDDGKVEGTVLHIQRFTVHDGKGIRTMVFLKGCPLRCRWCSNPESQRATPEKGWNPTRCLGSALCGHCAVACPEGAVKVAGGLLRNDFSRCRSCLRCTEACPTGAQIRYGERLSVQAVLEAVEREGAFYHRSGGGLTLSGGEALMQPVFTLALLREARRRHLNTAMETCGHAPLDDLRAACGLLHMLIYDIKHLDPAAHRKGTGGDNSLILDNFRHIMKEFPHLPILVRTPLVPDFNNTEAAVRAILNFLPRQSNIAYELLPYHRMGMPKYSHLGRKYEVEETLDEGLFRRLQEEVRKEFPTG